MHLRILHLCLLAGALPAQSPAPLHPLDPGHWFVAPLHTSRSGAWHASAPDYKVAIDDGVTLYPRLGATALRHLPLRWTTTAVRCGGEPVGTSGFRDTVAANGFRLERSRGAVTERYDLMAEGIEQSFVVDALPASTGDLTITGRIDTPLQIQPGDTTMALRCVDDAGQVRATYGQAVAFDADGRTTPVASHWEAGQLELRVPAAWLATARLPVTVDPLLAPVVADQGPDAIDMLDLAHDGGATTSNTLLVYTRAFLSGDHDVFARTTNADFQNSNLVFVDVAPGLVSLHAHGAAVEGAGRWVIAYQQDDNAVPISDIQLYLHDRGSLLVNAGHWITLPRLPGSTMRYPDVGGAANDGRKALIVYQSDVTQNQTNTPNTETWATVLDASNLSLAATMTLGHFTAGTTYDRELPTVVPQCDGDGFSWVVAWHEYYTQVPTDDWDVNVARISPFNTRTALFRFGIGGDPRHKRYPRLDGRGSRYLLAFAIGGEASAPTAEEIMVQRFDWLESQTAPVMQLPRTLVRDTVQPDFCFPRVAFDDRTRSHWAISWQRGTGAGNSVHAARVGFRGGITEQLPVLAASPDTVIDQGVVFDRGAGVFQLAMASNGSAGGTLRGARFVYPAGALSTFVGSGCGGQIQSTPPYAGSEFFTVSLAGALPGVASILLLSAPTAAIDLGAAGMPGCALYAALPGYGLWPVLTSPQGSAAVTLALDDTPLVLGDVHLQWLHLAPGANAAGVLATSGLRAAIR